MLSALTALAFWVDGEIGPAEMVMYSGAISLAGGFAAALRLNHDRRTTITYGVNTMVLGASLSLMGYAVFHNHQHYLIASVGVSGALSLGGLASVDWVFGLLKSRIEKKVKNDE